MCIRSGLAYLLLASIPIPCDAETPRPFRDAALEVGRLAVATDAESADAARASALGSGAAAHIDPRTGRFATLMPATPILAGRRDADAAWRALRGWLAEHARTLRIDVGELGSPNVDVIGPDFIQVFVPRVVDGVNVRDAGVVATIAHGRLTLLGFGTWADTPAPADARLDAPAAELVLARRYGAVSARAPPQLEWLPEADRGALRYRLAWSHRIDAGDPATAFEALVDARRGDVIALQPLEHHLATPRTVGGGVLPQSNDGVLPDGVEQPDWPMPFTEVTTPGGALVTDAGGRVPACVDGELGASLSGPYAEIADGCGAIALGGPGDLDFGVSGGTDCATPGIGGPGNTRAARTAFYEVNRSSAIARALLPGNAWLQAPIRVETNTVGACDARYLDSRILLYRSGGGCGNSGEIAGIVAHEWAHGLDDNSGSGTISRPAETYADAFAALRTDLSCIGRGFLAPQICQGGGENPANPCTTCTGVRDIDYANHDNPQPFTVTTAQTCFVSGTGPCGKTQQCESQVASQAAWDLWNRDLPATMPRDTARELVMQLMVRGSGQIDRWYDCTQGSGGCSASTGYLQWLAADDDDGNLVNGTPHMAAIHAAFSRHGIACATPAVTDSGCSGTPSVAPVVTAAPRDGAVALSWTSVPLAQSYRVYRTDGVGGCAQGKELVASTTATSFLDTGLRNGRPYSYIVIPMGAADTCFGRSSACVQATPVPGPDTTLVAAEASVSVVTGDGDAFLENCEFAEYRIPFENTGSGAASNVRITGASSPSHPETEILTTFPVTVAASQASCATNEAVLSFRPFGLTAGTPLQLDVTWTSDDLGGATRTTRLSYDDVQRAAKRGIDPRTPAGSASPCVEPILQVSPPQLPFDAQRWNGGTPQTLQLTLTNVGTGTIDESNLAATLVTGTHFALGTPVGLPIAPSESATLAVTFDPSAAGAFNDSVQLSLDDDDPARPAVTVALTGVGTQSTQTFAPAPFHIGSVTLGQTGSASIELGNAGSATLNLAGSPAALTLDGGNAADFRFGSHGCNELSACDPTPSTIAPGGSTSIVLRCTPSAAGTRSTTLTVASDDPASPRTIAVTCTGATPTADVVFVHGFED